MRRALAVRVHSARDHAARAWCWVLGCRPVLVVMTHGGLVCRRCGTLVPGFYDQDQRDRLLRKPLTGKRHAAMVTRPGVTHERYEIGRRS